MDKVTSPRVLQPLSCRRGADRWQWISESNLGIFLIKNNSYWLSLLITCLSQVISNWSWYHFIWSPSLLEKVLTNTENPSAPRPNKKCAGESSHRICSSEGCRKQTWKDRTLLLFIVCACVYVCLKCGISVFEPFDVIMSFPLCLPICFSSSLCFSVMSTLLSFE